jgi:hypothetical protein
MGIKRRQWTQQQWTHPGARLHRAKGDYDDAEGFLLAPTGDRLVRAPGWSSHIALPAGIADVQAVTYDRDNERTVTIGADDADSPSKVVASYFDSDWAASSVTDLITGGPTGLGGRYLQNIAWLGGYLYVIADDNNVYRGTDYTSTLTSFYTGADAALLVALQDRLYLLTDAGAVYRLNDGDTAFESYYTPTVDLTILYAAPFAQYLALLGKRADGALNLYRLYPDYTPSLDHLLPIAATGDYPDNAKPCLIHNGALLLTTGEHTAPDGWRTFPLFRFTGQTLALLDNAPTTLGTVEPWTVGSTAIGGPAYISSGSTSLTETLALLTWRTYALLASIAGGSTQLRITADSGFITFPNPSTSSPSEDYLPLCTVAGDHLVLLSADTSDNEGLYHTTPTTYHSPATFTTARLDFNQPGRQKRINRLTALLSDAHADVTITLEYRTDDATSWTTATSAANSRRVSVDLDDVQAYTMQVRLTLTDTGDHAVDLLDLEVDYSA